MVLTCMDAQLSQYMSISEFIGMSSFEGKIESISSYMRTWPLLGSVPPCSNQRPYFASRSAL